MVSGVIKATFRKDEREGPQPAVDGMFTGIIEELGTIRESVPRGGGHFLRVECKAVLDGLERGGSIAVNGPCLTAVEINSSGFAAELSPETVSRSTLAGLPVGTRVNLERSLRLSDRLEGHMVTGHIDGTGSVRNVRRTRDFWEIEYAAPPEILRYVVEKGSIAVDGVSLTVAGTGDESFTVAVIPETVRRTNIKSHEPGRAVNLEADIIAKYVERFTSQGKDTGGGVTLDQLREYGYVEKE
jgi:riboflavin synthase